MKKKTVFIKLFAFLMVLTMVLGTVPVSAKEKKVEVKTKKGLLSAVKDKKAAKIVFSTSKSVKVTIPAGDTAANKTLIVKAPKAKITNKAVFKSIELKSASTFTEAAKGNKITVSGKVSKLTGKTAKFTLKAGSSAKTKLTIAKKTSLEITGNKKADIDVVNKAKDSKITASIPVDIEASAKTNLTLLAGSEGSVVNSVNNTTVKVTNKSSQAPTIEYDGVVDTTPTVTSAPTPTGSGSKVTPVPTPTSSVQPTGTVQPTGAIVIELPTETPTQVVTQAPTQNPTKTPTQNPTQAPTQNPTKAPTQAPTQNPTKTPTQAPTQNPTKTPTQAPTQAPTQNPTQVPTQNPTQAPTQNPTQAPTQNPTQVPTQAPTQNPTQVPTQAPTDTPAQGATLSVLVTYDQSGARSMLSDINNYRKTHGINEDGQLALTYDYTLEKAAMLRAAEIVVKYDDVNHKRPNGGTYLNAFQEYGYNTSGDSEYVFGEIILFADNNKLQNMADAYARAIESTPLAKIVRGYFTSVAVSHVRVDNNDFWVLLFTDAPNRCPDATTAVNGEKYATVNVPLNSDSIVFTSDYVSGAKSVAVGSTVDAPVYKVNAYFPGGKLNKVGISTVARNAGDEYLVFNSSNDCIKLENGKVTGVKTGTGTLSATYLGKTVDASISVN